MSQMTHMQITHWRSVFSVLIFMCVSCLLGFFEGGERPKMKEWVNFSGKASHRCHEKKKYKGGNQTFLSLFWRPWPISIFSRPLKTACFWWVWIEFSLLVFPVPNSPTENSDRRSETSDVTQKAEAFRPVSQPPVFSLPPLCSWTKEMNEGMKLLS